MDNWSESSVDTFTCHKIHSLLSQSLFQFWVVYFRKRNTNRCLFTSQQRGRGAPSKHAHNATTITKLKNSKCQNIFRCIFDDFFFEFFNGFRKNFSMFSRIFSNCYCLRKCHFQSVFIFTNFLFSIFFFLGLISGGSRVRKISVISKI